MQNKKRKTPKAEKGHENKNGNLEKLKHYCTNNNKTDGNCECRTAIVFSIATGQIAPHAPL
jgi:hypothetical protein